MPSPIRRYPAPAPSASLGRYGALSASCCVSTTSPFQQLGLDACPPSATPSMALVIQHHRSHVKNHENRDRTHIAAVDRACHTQRTAAPMMQHSRVLTLLALLLAAVPARAQPSEIVRSWNFAVSLDGDLIGTHRFDLRQAGPSLAMRGHADFAVKFLGLTLYRYRHEVTSRWQDACLDNLSAQTDDDGEKTSVSATASATATRVIRRRDGSGESELTVSGCMMDFAYWNPNLLTQTRLLNPQTGEIEAVQIIAGRTGAVQVQGAAVSARSWRILGAAQPIEVWYSAQGAWIGLDATVKGSRTLSYRLQ